MHRCSQPIQLRTLCSAVVKVAEELCLPQAQEIALKHKEVFTFFHTIYDSKAVNNEDIEILGKKTWDINLI